MSGMPGDRPPEVAKTEEQTAKDNTTTFRETRIAGRELLEAASTTGPPNSRFLVVRDGKLLNEDERDDFLTHVRPNYAFVVQPGESVMVMGRDRNAYSPGSDYVARSASRIVSPIPDGQYVPDGVTFQTGLADLTEDAGFGPARNREGMVLRFTPDDAEFLNYRDGEPSVVRSHADGEWKNDVFRDGYSLRDHVVKGVDGNLYGAGEQHARLLYRDSKTREQSKEVATLAEPRDPVSDEYNLFVTSAKVEVAPDADAVTVQVGPLNYANLTENRPPEQVKSPKYRDVPADETLGADNFTVAKVYRIKPTQRSTSVTVGNLSTISEVADCALEAREVHPDWLDFGAVDPEDPSNWTNVPDTRPAEMPLEELDLPVGSVSLDLDSNNERRGFFRGESESRVSESGGGRGSSTPLGMVSSLDVNQRLSEFYYLVLLIQISDTTETVDLVKPSFVIRR